MQRILLIIAIFSICAIIISGVGLLLLRQVRNQLDIESKLYVDTIIPTITSSWDTVQLITNASPEFLYFNPPERIESWFAMFSRHLGPLREYRGSKGRAAVNYFAPEGKITTAIYIADVLCEKAPATIQVAMILRQRKWQILEFRLNSRVFVQ